MYVSYLQQGWAAEGLRLGQHVAQQRIQLAGTAQGVRDSNYAVSQPEGWYVLKENKGI